MSGDARCSTQAVPCFIVLNMIMQNNGKRYVTFGRKPSIYLEVNVWSMAERIFNI